MPSTTNGENINVTKSTQKHSDNGISHLHKIWDPIHLLVGKVKINNEKLNKVKINNLKHLQN
jgi:hypothetical protein